MDTQDRCTPKTKVLVPSGSRFVAAAHGIFAPPLPPDLACIKPLSVKARQRGWRRSTGAIITLIL